MDFEVTIGKQVLTVRPLTRGTIKGLRASGVSLETAGAAEDVQKRDDALDQIFAAAMVKGDPDELTQGEALELWSKIVGFTYGTVDAAKNSASPRHTTSRRGGGTAGSAKRAGSRAKDTVPVSTEPDG